jgi:hypothetical protein
MVYNKHRVSSVMVVVAVAMVEVAMVAVVVVTQNVWQI